MMPDGREWIALLRRHYLHVRAGGSLTEHDLARHVAAAEQAQARIERAEEQRDRARAWIMESMDEGEWVANPEDALADEPQKEES